MTRHPDPIIRRVLVYDRARARTRRRVAAPIAYLDAETTVNSDAKLRRLDDLLGQADRLRRALA